MATSRVTPLNSGSTQNEPPNCWMPEMPAARMTTPMIVPQTLTRPGRIVAEIAVPFSYPRRPELRFEPDFAVVAGQISARLRREPA